MSAQSSCSRFILNVITLGLSGVLTACGGGGGGLETSAAFSTNSTASNTPVAPSVSAAVDTVSLKSDSTCALQYSNLNLAAQIGPDPLFIDQWHLRNTGQRKGLIGEDINVLPAWSISKGAGVQIALVDDALEITHPDLKANTVTGASYNYRGDLKGSAFPLPCSSVDSHGTAVAGIVAASASNAIGTVGIAPDARIVGYNALALDKPADIADALIRDNQRNAIYNNSWGSPDTGELNEAEPEFVAAIAAGLKSGRGGLGSVFVFPAGNGGCYLVAGSSGCNVDSANLDGYINQIGVIAVGSLTNQGKAPWYGERGSNILVSAPAGDSNAGITTTAISNDYRHDFVGTSASTPMVTGVAALMLAANPKLSWRDVPIILARTARKNDVLDDGWKKGFNHRYGFGAVDAAAAVKLAQNWISVGDSRSLLSCATSVTVNANITDDAAPLLTKAALSDCAIQQIEYVTVIVNMRHEYSGDLTIDLISPSGAVSHLATPRLCESTDRSVDRCGAFERWQFGSVRHLDEAALGSWQLMVKDTVAGKTGALLSWTLTAYGR